jgi:hypothetical protein
MVPRKAVRQSNTGPKEVTIRVLMVDEGKRDERQMSIP